MTTDKGARGRAVTPVSIEYPLGDDPSKATLYYGSDVRVSLRQLPENCIQCVCTSPPYW